MKVELEAGVGFVFGVENGFVKCAGRVSREFFAGGVGVRGTVYCRRDRLREKENK